MYIEQQLEKLNDNLERLVAALNREAPRKDINENTIKKTGGPKDDGTTTAEEVKKKQEEKTAVSQTDIRKTGTEFMQAKGKDGLKTLLAEFNIEKISELPEDRYEDFMKAASLVNG